MSEDFDLFGQAVLAPPDRRGRPGHEPTEEIALSISYLAAAGFPHIEIAPAISLAEPTMRKHYSPELRDYGRAAVGGHPRHPTTKLPTRAEVLKSDKQMTLLADPAELIAKEILRVVAEAEADGVSANLILAGVVGATIHSMKTIGINSSTLPLLLRNEAKRIERLQADNKRATERPRK